MDLRLKRLAAVAFAGTVTAVLIAPSSAIAGEQPDLSELATPEMLAAIERDFGMSTSEALDRLASDHAAMQVHEALSETLGEAFAGSWIEDGELVVAIADASEATAVQAAGAEPRLVSHSGDALESTVSTLDAAAAPAASDVYGWHVDVAANEVVVLAAPGSRGTVWQWIAESGVDTSTIRIETADHEAPQLYFDIVGGFPYDVPGSGCSVGFAVLPRGFVTAGHCGAVGTPTTGHNGAAQGVFQHSIFPGEDSAYVAVNENWALHALVDRYDGTFEPVNGSQVAPIGAMTCRSGRTSGYQCGTIEAYNQTVNYAQGAVHGLTRTNACAAPGDSGGSFIAAGVNAQGVTSGGSGFCGSGQPPQTFFQPVNPMLSAWGLTLVTQ